LILSIGTVISGRIASTRLGNKVANIVEELVNKAGTAFDEAGCATCLFTQRGCSSYETDAIFDVSPEVIVAVVVSWIADYKNCQLWKATDQEMRAYLELWTVVHRGSWWWSPGQSKSALFYCHLDLGTLTGVGA
jgi:hypothetical protein